MGESPDSRLAALTTRLEQLERRSTLQRRVLLGAVLAVVTLGSTTLYAQATWAPPGFNVFAQGSPARASEVNANFQWLVQQPGDVFLSRKACPAGYTAYEGGQYLRLGAPSLTPVARTLVAPAHRHDDMTGLTAVSNGAHSHSHNDYYWSDNGNQPEYSTPTGDASGELRDATRSTGTAGAHTHSLSGRVGPSTGVSGDANIAITGELQHLTLRLCVRT